MSGFTNEVVNANNVDFSGGSPVSAKLVNNGQMLIGSTALNAGGTHINVGSLISPSSTLTMGYSSPNITIEVTGADAGKILQGNGVGSPPIYSTATYPSSTVGSSKILYDNGTNFVTSIPTFPVSASATSRKMIVSDGTNWVASTETWAVPGTSGNILTSNGTNWLSSTPTGTFSPNSTFQLYDDFISIISSSTNINGLLSWTTQTTSWTNANGTATNAHPGVLGHPSNATGDNRYIMLGGAANFSSQIFVGGGILTLNWVFNIVNLSNGTNRYTMFCGITDTLVSTLVNGIGIAYSDNVNGGNYTYKCVASSVATTSNSAVAATTGWHNAQVVINANASSVSFSVDGVSLGTAITTNIPTTGMSPLFSFIQSAGTIAAGSLLIDLFYLNQSLTTAR